MQAGGLRSGALVIAGQTLMFFDSAIEHAFDPRPVITDGGNAAFSQLSAWIGDRFGFTWRLDNG